MTWNYRVMTLDEGKSYAVHEVYYDEVNRPIMYNPSACKLDADSLEDLKETLRGFAAAMDRPFLTPDNFPENDDTFLERDFLF